MFDRVRFNQQACHIEKSMCILLFVRGRADKGEPRKRRPTGGFALSERICRYPAVAALNETLPKRVIRKRRLNDDLALPAFAAGATRDLNDRLGKPLTGTKVRPK